MTKNSRPSGYLPDSAPAPRQSDLSDVFCPDGRERDVGDVSGWTLGEVGGGEVCRGIGPAGNSSLTWAAVVGQKLINTEMVLVVPRSALLAGWVAPKQSTYPACCRQATEDKGIRAHQAALRI